VLTVDGKESSQPLKVEADPVYAYTEQIAEQEQMEGDDDSDEEKAEAEAEGRRVIDID
jgi:hypothetical protein